MDLRSSSNKASLGVECRAALPHEYLIAADLRGEMAREMGSDFDAMASDWHTKFSAYFAGKHAGGNAEVFLAFDGEVPVGCAIVSVLEHYRRYVFGAELAYVNAVYVRPFYRRRGIASRLMQLAIEWSRARGCKAVRLRASDDGRVLYEQLGFHAGREMELDL